MPRNQLKSAIRSKFKDSSFYGVITLRDNYMYTATSTREMQGFIAFSHSPRNSGHALLDVSTVRITKAGVMEWLGAASYRKIRAEAYNVM